MPNKTHNDNPSNICQLDRQAWSKRIVDQIKDFEPPKVIGVHGTWGTGKTSLLRQMYHEMGGTHFRKRKKKPNVNGTLKVVWFEAWQYQHEPNILAALLKEIREQLSLSSKLWEEAKEMAVVGSLSLLQSISATFDNFGAVFGASKGMSRGFATNYMENTKAYQAERFAAPLDSVTLKKQLQHAIDQLLYGTFKINKGNRNRKAVIFIDDLDRCEPDTAFRILESIKVYLNLNNCVFVLGMDVKALDDIIAKYYKKELGADKHVVRNRARLYLEKICQDIYPLPTPKHTTRSNYLKTLLIQNISIGEVKFKEPFELINHYKFLPPFPRSIKIFANAVISHLNSKDVRQFAIANDDNLKAFLIVTYLYSFHLEIYNLIYYYESFYKEVFLSHCIDPDPTLVHSNWEVGGEDEIKNLNVHPELQHLVIYKEYEDSTADEVMGGQTTGSNNREFYARMYPSEHLRQVLWISKLVIERGNIARTDIQQLQL